MKQISIAPVVRTGRDGARTDQDLVAVEAPLTITIVSGAGTATSLGLFMRTPGDDLALATGLLFAEGIVCAATDVAAHTIEIDADGVSAKIALTLAAHVAFDAGALARAGIATTACGLCGRLTDRLPAARNIHDIGRQRTALTPDVIAALPDRLRDAQAMFAETGGLHAAGFCDRTGTLIDSAEDVGRHNAVDKLVGRALAAGRLPASDLVLVVSGRVAFEIVQKAAAAGVKTLVSVGAPTSLAVQAAREANMTLIGFVRDGGFNTYASEA